MARQRISTPQRRQRRRKADGLASERWLLLLGASIAVAIICGTMYGLPWRSGPARLPAHVPLTMAQARASNAAVPFAADRRAVASPFVFHGGVAARAQAIDCLATAAIYEAGDEPRGQAAVIQVILNRARQPGFPRTVCGVVYQGATRTTGCQFSFTCDGSAARRPEHAGWTAARRIARRALRGRVFAPVGTATNYHADWMVPYWRGSLDKVAQVNTHIFYARRVARP
jgi:spore germination cell wall hydrolase CwlJ-like protein